MKVERINTGLNEKFTLVTVHFSVTLPDGSFSGGNLEVQLPGQNYDLTDLKALATQKARLVLEAVLSDRSSDSPQE